MPKSDQKKAEIRSKTEAKRCPEKNRLEHATNRGNRPLSLKDLSIAELKDDEFTAALDILRNGSDRELGIMGAALIEDALVHVIKSALSNSDNDKALFHDMGAPFGTFEAKTTAAFAMGLCDERTAKEMNTIRSIRNQFSHALRPFSFAEASVKNACQKLSAYLLVEMHSAGEKPNTNQPRFKYEAACTGIWLKLMVKANQMSETAIVKTEQASTSE